MIIQNMLYAKQVLLENDYTCVLYDGQEIIYSTKRGVGPLLEWIETNRIYDDFSAADKVVGKATAFLYALLNIKCVYAKVISKRALEVFERYDISCTYDVLVEEIKNRAGTGCCPMEECTKNISEAEKALIAVRTKYNELKNN